MAQLRLLLFAFLDVQIRYKRDSRCARAHVAGRNFFFQKRLTDGGAFSESCRRLGVALRPWNLGRDRIAALTSESEYRDGCDLIAR